jgi:hypothetical protein
MRGEGAPRQTVFGVLGKTMESPLTKTLGGLVEESTKVNAPKVAVRASKEPKNTDHHILGKAAKTHIPGSHMGQVPYAGQYMSHVGARL